jgi:mRNA interferase MazF
VIRNDDETYKEMAKEKEDWSDFDILTTDGIDLVKVQRYEIYYADLNPTVGSELKKIRPVVVVSKTEMSKYLNTVVVCPLTTTLHPKRRSRIQIKYAQNKVEIAVDQIRTISKKRF